MSELLSTEDYLENEKRSERKSEYIAGVLRDMPGTDEVHFAIRLNYAFLLKEHLSRREGDCRIYVGDMKVQVAAANAFLYPDILVSCDAQDLSQNYYKSSPVLIVEVLSASDAGFDRGRKFALYRQLPSLREYVLIDAEYPAVDCFRLEDGRWVLYPYGESEQLELPSLGFRCDVTDIYQDIFSEEE